jgi:hypothetical protein
VTFGSAFESVFEKGEEEDHMNYRTAIGVLSVVLCLGFFPKVGNGQNVARIQIGDLWETPDGLESPLGLEGLWLIWPGGGEKGSSLFEGGFRTNSSGARLRLMFKDFKVEEKDSLGNIIRTQIIPYYHPSYAPKTKTEAYLPTQVKFMRTYRTSTTVNYEDGSVHQNLVDKQGQYLIEKPTLLSDELIEYTEFFSDGFYVKQSYYAWANQFHDDYIIRVVDIVNNGNLDDNVLTSEMTPKDLKGLYLDLYVNNLSPNNKGEGFYSFEATGTWDNWHDYYGDTQNDSLRLMYAFDGDDPNVPGDDQGDPYPSQFATTGYDPTALYSPGEFVSAMYAGYGVLFVDKSATNHQNDFSQPFSFGYDSFTAAPGWREELRWLNVYNSGIRAFKHPDYSKTVPKNLESCWMAFGPFDLPANGNLRLVFVHAVNGPSIAACKEIGGKYLRHEITKSEKDSFLRASYDSLITTIKRAQWNWDNFLSKNKSIPNGPKPPTNLRIASNIKAVRLEWDKSKSNDVSKYAVYRKAGTNLGDFEKIGEIPSTVTIFVDSLLDIGVSYYYYVTALNDGSANTDPTCYLQPLESSKFINRSYYPARAYREASQSLSNVRVVPNPYNLFQARTFPGDADRITFTNLSRRCTIRIFSVNGDLVKTIKKDDASSYVAWNPMLTDDNLFIAPDVYIYFIEDLDTGQKALGKFVVVR